MAHFARWLVLWAAAVDEWHAREKAELAKVQARRIDYAGRPATELVTIRSQPPDQRPS